MRDELLDYYESELAFLRQMGAEFAEKYPKVASRLALGPNIAEDPHVERLVESFAFLAARVHLKIDDDFPEITESLLNVLYPHFLRPIPSMSVVEFAVDPNQGKLTTAFNVARNSVLYSRPVEGVPCKFRTCYDATAQEVVETRPGMLSSGIEEVVTKDGSELLTSDATKEEITLSKESSMTQIVRPISRYCAI